MNNKLIFITSSIKSDTVDVEAVVNTEKIKYLLSQLGFYFNRTETFISAILPVLKKMDNDLPQIQNGPVPSLQTDYSKIIGLQDLLTSALEEIDKKVTLEEEGSELLIEAFNHLGQFYQYIPYLISPTAPSMSSYIESLQQSISLVTETLERLLEFMGNCKDKVLEESESLTFSDEKYAHWRAACSILAQLQEIDLYFLLGYECIQNEYQPTIHSCIEAIESLISNLLKSENIEDIYESIKKITEGAPSLYTIYAFAAENIPEKEFISLITVRMVHFISFILEVINKKNANEVIERVQKIPELLSGENPNKDEIKEATKVIIDKFNEYAKSDYIANKKEAELLSKEITDVFKNEGSTGIDIANAAISAAKFIGYSVLSLKYSKEILDETNMAITKILNGYLLHLKEDAANIEDTYTENVDIFNEGELGQANYHIQVIKNVKDFDPADKDCLKNINIICSSALALPDKTRVLTSSCDEELKERFDKIANDVEDISVLFTKWYGQILSSVSTTILNSAQNITTSIVNTLNDKKLDDNEDVKKTLVEAIKVNDSIKNEPLFLATNVEKSVNIIKYLSDFSANACGEDGEYSKLCNKIITESNNERPVLIEQISNAFVPLNVHEFVSVASSIIKRALPIITGAKEVVDESVSSKMKSIYNELTALCVILSNSPEELEEFKQLTESINASLNMIWPLAMDYQQSNAENIKSYISSLSQLLIEFESNTEMYVPFIEVDIPKELRTFRTLEATATSLSSASLRHNAIHMMSRFKDLKTPQVIEFLSQWFDLANEEEFDLNALSQDILSQQLDSETLISSLSKMSIALTKTMEKMEPQQAEYIEKKLSESLNTLYSFLSNPNEKDLNILKASYSALTNVTKLANLTGQTRENMLKVAVSNADINLDNIRKGENNVVGCISSLLNLEEFLFFNNKEVYEEFKDFLEYLPSEIVSGNTEHVNEVIEKLSNFLRQFSPDKYEEFVKLEDPNLVCDLAYEKSEFIRECSNIILKEAKQHTLGSNVINNVLAQISTLAYETAIVTMQSLKNESLTDTSIIREYTKSVNEIFAALSEFEAYAHTISDTEDVATLTRNLRQASRTMAKKIDGFINYVETPPKAEPDTEFEAKKTKFFFAFSEVSLQFGRVISRLDASPVKEIFAPEKEGLIAAFEEKAELLKAAYEEVIAEAVGPQVTIFNDAYNKYLEMVETTKSLLASEEPYEAKKYAADACSFAQTIVSASEDLNSTIIILPDPEQARRIPDEFVLPQLPTSAPSPPEAFEKLKDAAKIFEDEINNMSEKCAEGENEDIVEEVYKLIEVGYDFSVTCSSMLVTTIDARMQVEQQTIVHTFANDMNELLESIRAKIMIVPNADNNISECISSIHKVTKELVDLGEAASKLQPVQEEETEDIVIAAAETFDNEDDAVTSELNATASAIEEMSARLEKFSEMFGDSAKDFEVSDEIDEDDDEDSSDSNYKEITEVDASDFPSFVISQARIILNAASQMVKRATQITRDIIATVGQLSNERMLISLAQELTDDASLILICAEMLINGTGGDDPEFKVIAAAKIVKATVSQLVAQVLVQGGDPEGIMNKHVKVVRICSNHIVRNAEAIVRDRVTKMEAKKKKIGNRMVQKLNAQTVVNQKRKELQDNEQAVYKYRRQIARK